MVRCDLVWAEAHCATVYCYKYPLLRSAGIVIKCNANQRYATTNVTSFLFRALAGEAGVPVQNFVVRQVRDRE